MSKHGKRRILVAEDSPTQAVGIQYVLETQGYEVRLARNGREALEAVTESAPDLIISDVVMPEMDGFAFCKAIKSSEATRRIPFVLLTSQQTPMDILVGLERGADNFIPKPFEDIYLVERLNRIFDNMDRRQAGGLEMEVTVRLGGREIVVNADKQQMLELLFSTSEELSESNRHLEEARLALAAQARSLERTVEERTRELAKAEARYRTVVEHIPAVVYLASAEEVGHLLYISPQIEGVLGWTPSECLAAPGFLERLLHPDDGEAVLEHARRLRKPEGPYVGEFRVRARDGRDVWLNASASLFDGGTGSVVQGFLVDISERKRVEDQLRQSQKMEAIGQLAGGVAHDFNNLLGVITGYTDLLIKDLGPQHAGMRRLEQVHKAADRAAALTRQLLAFSRKQVLQPKVLDLNGLVADLEGMLRRLISEDIELVTVFSDDIGRVKADPGQIEQVIVNLAVNSRDAMPKGGRLIIETANVDLDEAYLRTHPGARPGPHVLLAVSDTGHGIDTQTQARVFEPFFTTKEMGKGTGLGLSTVYGIVKQSGGYVTVYSEPGHGSSFKVYLPRVESEAEATDTGSSRPAVSAPVSETVLLVEDEPSLRELVREILEDGGYVVVAAGTSEEALAAIHSHAGTLHLLLTDVVMPHMGGSTLGRQAALDRPDMKVLYMSGYTDEAIVRNGVLAADAAFLQKPFSADALLRKIREVLEDTRKRS